MSVTMPVRICILFAMLTPLAHAEAHTLYRQQDGNHLIYRDTPSQGSQRIASLTPKSPPKRRTYASPKKPRASALSTPRVSPSMQQQRDAHRQRLLEQELADETAALQKAEHALKHTPPHQHALWQRTIRDHQHNLTAIRAELARLR